MNTTGTITMSMRELDRLKVIQAVAEAPTQARPCRRTAGLERAADRAAGAALSGSRRARSGVGQARRAG